MAPSPSIFRAYDIRGIYPEEINEKSAYKIGRAFAAYLKESEAAMPEKAAVGYDARLSSPVLFRAFINGAVDEGISVWDIGLVPVDAAYFASGKYNIPAAMITASHNPKEWNGFKLMKSGVEFFDVKNLETVINFGISKNAADFKKGEITSEDIKTDYLKHVLSFIDIETIKPMRIAVDASSGAVGPVMELLLKKLPVEYASLNFSPDGDFPRHEPDPTRENNLSDLISEVKSGHYHFGCAFDGDGDRIIFVDENGETINPSIIGALMERYLLKQNRYGKIVYVAVASRIIEDVARAHGGEAIREKVGHTYVAGRMRAEGGILGIETSGHYFFKDNFYADSGIISFLMMLQILSLTNKNLSVLAGELSKYFSINEINFKTENPDEFIKKIARNFEGYDVDWLDGLTVTTSDFWLNIRASNTEPLLRLNIEAKDEIILNRVKKDLINLIKNI